MGHIGENLAGLIVVSFTVKDPSCCGKMFSLENYTFWANGVLIFKYLFAVSEFTT